MEITIERNEIINKAADLIKERGLALGKMQDEHGRLCIIGAINLAGQGNAFGPQPYGYAEMITGVPARALYTTSDNIAFGSFLTRNKKKAKKAADYLRSFGRS